MSVQRTLRYIFIALCSLLGCGEVPSAAGAAADTVAVADTATREHYLRQLNIGTDVSAPFRNVMQKGRTAWELAADYYLKGEIYLAAEAGWGGSSVDYPDLKYTTTNTFLRVGINKMLLPRDEPADWGGMMLGLRLAAASISRSSATYALADSLWGNSSGTTPAKQFGGYWAEVTGGVRVELLKGVMAGWNIRGKFMLNSKSFADLAPLQIAGYGRGDKNAVFDINVYLSYAIRWERK